MIVARVALLLPLLLLGLQGLSAQDSRSLYNQVAPEVVYLRHEVYIPGSKSKQKVLWKKFETITKVPFLDHYLTIASGSGFFIDDQGRMVTNRHVVELKDEAQLYRLAYGMVAQGIDETGTKLSTVDKSSLKTDLQLMLNDAAYRFSAAVGTKDLGLVTVLAVAGPEEADLALVQTPESSGDPLPMAPDSAFDTRLVGGEVASFGYPLGATLDNVFKERVVTMNQGGISAFRGTELLDLQHNAAISPGNSGGPLVDKQGRVLGVNAAGFDSSQANSLYYAVSAKKIRAFLTAKGFATVAFWNGYLAQMAVARSIGLPRNAAGELESPAAVVLTTAPDVAVVLNGKALGSGSQALFLTQELNKLELRSPTYQVEYTLHLMPEITTPGVLRLSAANRLPLAEITSEPSEATVVADGRELGVTPLSVELPQGSYSISLKKDGVAFLPVQLKVSSPKAALRVEGLPAFRLTLLSPTTLGNAQFTFHAAAGDYSFASETEIALPKGAYDLRVKGAEGLTDVSIPITTTGAPQEFDLTPFLKRAPLAIRGLGLGSRIWVDGAEWTGPKDEGLKLPAGVHTVGAWEEGFQPLTPTRITVRENGKSFLTWKKAEGSEVLAGRLTLSAVLFAASGLALGGTGWWMGQDSQLIPQSKSYNDYLAKRDNATLIVESGIALAASGLIAEICALVTEGRYQAQKKEFGL